MSEGLTASPFDPQTSRTWRPPPLKPAHARWIAKLTLMAAGAYTLSLVVTLPARTVLHWAGAKAGLVDGASGTAWNGAVALGSGVSARWRLAPLRSLLSLSPSVNLNISGPDTRLIGRAHWSNGGVVVEPLTGIASWSLVDVLAPRLPFGCDATLRVNIERLALAPKRFAAVGEAASLPAICRSRIDPAAAPTAAPSLVASAALLQGSSRFVVRPRGRPSETLISASLSPAGQLRLSVSAAAAAMAPGGSVAGPVELEVGP